MIRKSWRRFFRLAKKMGLKPTDRWPEPLESRYWRFWFGLIKRARAQRSEPMDVDVINKMFGWDVEPRRSEEHTSELQSLMRISYAVFCLNKKKKDEPIPY